MSDLDEDVSLCNAVGDDCIKCNEEYCNAQDGDSKVLCTTCSSDDDESCGYRQVPNEDNSRLCTQLLGRENLCFAYGNETYFSRGCLSEHPEFSEKCAENNDECQICDEDSCNSMKIVEELCVSCDSRTDPNCRSLAETPTPTLCGDETFDKSGCYLSDKGKIY